MNNPIKIIVRNNYTKKHQLVYLDIRQISVEIIKKNISCIIIFIIKIIILPILLKLFLKFFINSVLKKYFLYSLVLTTSTFLHVIHNYLLFSSYCHFIYIILLLIIHYFCLTFQLYHYK